MHYLDCDGYIFTPAASLVQTSLLDGIPMKHLLPIAPLTVNCLIFLYLACSGPLKKISALTVAAP